MRCSIGTLDQKVIQVLARTDLARTVRNLRDEVYCRRFAIFFRLTGRFLGYTDRA